MLLPSYRESGICHLLNAEIESKVHLAIHTKQWDYEFQLLFMPGRYHSCVRGAFSHLIFFKCPASEYPHMVRGWFEASAGHRSLLSESSN